jgi:hypothetical protein
MINFQEIVNLFEMAVDPEPILQRVWVWCY